MRAKWILLGFLLLTLAGCRGGFSERAIAIPIDPDTVIQVTPDLTVRHIQYGAFEFTHSFPWPANSLAVVMGDHLVLVDTPYTPEATKELLEWMVLEVGAKQVIAINTHFHIDNLGGNAYLIEQGIPVYGADLTVQLLEERGQGSLNQLVDWLEQDGDTQTAAVYAGLDLRPPTLTFDIDQGLQLEFGGEHLQVYYPGPGHAPDNVVVYFPERRLLFGGCLIIGWDAVGNTADADLAAWPHSVGNLAAFETNILVPGHGPRLDPGLLEHTLQLLAEH